MRFKKKRVGLLALVGSALTTVNTNEKMKDKKTQKYIDPSEEGWNEYFKNSRQKEYVNELFLGTFARVKKYNPGQTLQALDLGTGTGAVAIRAAKEGFAVIATDKFPKALEIVNERATELNLSIETRKLDLDQDPLPKNMNLVTASLVLPFMNEDAIKQVMPKILQSIAPGGCFTGNFFRRPHPWCNDKNVNCPTSASVKKMLQNKDFDISVTETVSERVPPDFDKNAEWAETQFVTCRRNNI